jgi:hypothetical protein
MTWNTFFDIANGGGILLLILWFLIEKVWPALTNQIGKEAEFQHQIELRRVASAEATGTSIQELARSNITTNERIETMLKNQVEIQHAIANTANILTGALSRMDATRARSEGIEQGRKMHKKGDTGPLSDDKG